MGFAELDLTPPAEKLALLSARAEDASPEEAVTLRQECLALAQLACRDDDSQLARAAAELAAAYLNTGHPSAASRHAVHAEGLLLHADASAEQPALLARALQTQASAFAESRAFSKALDCFPRALAQSEQAFGPRHVSTCPMLRRFARMAVARSSDFARADQLLSAERKIRLGASGQQMTPEVRQLDQERAQPSPSPSLSPHPPPTFGSHF